jgi:hypothetical protein
MTITLEQVRDALRNMGGKPTNNFNQWADAIDAHLLSLDDELADYKNASLHAADDCTAKDAEIERLQSRLAAADALLRNIAGCQWFNREAPATVELIDAHLQGVGDE